MSLVADLGALIASSLDHRHHCADGSTRVPLGTVAKIINGYPFKSDGFGSKGAPVIRIRDVARGFTNTRYDGELPEGFWVESGDLIVGMDGDFCAAFWRSDRALLNQRVCKIVPDETRVDRRYLGYMLPGYLELINAHTPSVTVKHLSSRTLASIPLPLPTLAAQTRVADRIDELFTEIDDGEAALGRARADLGTWRKALLKAAVTGELTADWRAEREAQRGPPAETGPALLARILTDRRTRWHAEPRNKGKTYVQPVGPDASNLPELPTGWTWASIDQLSTRVTKGSSPGWQGFDYQLEGILFVRSQNVGWGKLKLDDRVYVDPAFNQVEAKAIIKAGDVLLNIVGASIGRACLADERLIGANTNQAVAGIRPVAGEIGGFLVHWLISPSGQKAVFANVVETARANLSLEQIRSIPVPLPPASELVAIGLAYEAAADAQVELLDEATEAVDVSATLRQSILAAAFRGELAR